MNQTHIRWTAVVVLGVVTLLIYRPRLHHTSIQVRGFEAFALAESLVEHRGFSDPFMPLPTGPSAHLPPLYPAYIASIILLFGNGPVAANIIIWIPAILLVLQLMIFPFLAETLGLGFWTGVVAALGWLAAGIPPSYTAEINYVSLLVIGATFLMVKSFREGLSRNWILLWAILWAGLLLLQPVVISVLAGWILLLCFRSRAPRAQIVALGLLPLLFVAPWMVRNLMVFHRPVFIRDNLGLELAVSNNPCASALFEDNDRNQCFAATHPDKNYSEALKVQELGEVEYNRMKLKEAKDWISANPREFATLTAERFSDFWLTPRSENKSNGMIWRPIVMQIFTLLSLPGLFLLWKSFRPGAYVSLLWLILFPPIYYVIQFMDRYRHPIFWVSFLTGSYFLVEMVRGLIGMPEPIQQQSQAEALSAQQVD